MIHRLTLFLIANFLLSGCASIQPRHLRPDNSMDRQIATVAYAGGGLIGFGGCVFGFITQNPIAIPICIGGWALGIGGIGYLALDDELRGQSYQAEKLKK